MAREGLAAMLLAPDQDVVVEAIELDSPGPNEVLVKLAASGVCHTDLTIKNLKGGGMKFPIILGHEGAGTVEEVGEGVTNLQPGDPVVIAYRAPCGQCPACRRDDAAHCYAALGAGPRIRRKSTGENCSKVLRCGTFATHAIVHSKAAIKMPANMPLDKACLIACGVVTGVGAAMHTATVFPGATVAVIGCGGVGLSVIQGARLQNARQIIGVDVNPVKLQWAKDFGATDVVDARDGDAVAAVRNLVKDPWPGYEGGVDFAYEATGLVKCIEQAVRMVCYNGTAVNIGFPGSNDEVTIHVGNIDTGLYWNKVNVKVCHCGDALPSRDFPVLADLYLKGKLNLDAMVTKKITINDVEPAFHAMEHENVIRSVIEF